MEQMGRDIGDSDGKDQVSEGDHEMKPASRYDIAQPAQPITGTLGVMQPPVVNMRNLKRGRPHRHPTVDPDHKGVGGQPDGDNAHPDQRPVQRREPQQADVSGEDSGVFHARAAEVEPGRGQLKDHAEKQQPPCLHGVLGDISRPATAAQPDEPTDEEGEQGQGHGVNATVVIHGC